MTGVIAACTARLACQLAVRQAGSSGNGHVSSLMPFDDLVQQTAARPDGSMCASTPPAQGFTGGSPLASEGTVTVTDQALAAEGFRLPTAALEETLEGSAPVGRSTQPVATRGRAVNRRVPHHGRPGATTDLARVLEQLNAAAAVTPQSPTSEGPEPRTQPGLSPERPAEGDRDALAPELAAEAAAAIALPQGVERQSQPTCRLPEPTTTDHRAVAMKPATEAAVSETKSSDPGAAREPIGEIAETKPLPDGDAEGQAPIETAQKGRAADHAAALMPMPLLAEQIDGTPEVQAPAQAALGAAVRRAVTGRGPAPADAAAMRTRLDNAIASAGPTAAPCAARETARGVTTLTPTPTAPPVAWADTPPDVQVPAQAAPGAAGRRAAADSGPEAADAAAMRARLDNAIASAGPTVAVGAAQEEASGAAARAPESAPAASAPAAPHDQSMPAAVCTQIVRAVSLSWREGVGEAHIRLDPATLGGLTVALRVERGVVSATMQTDLAAVRDVIHAHERDLRDGLASHGLDLGRLVVTADPDREHREPEAGQRQAPRRTRHADPSRPFELEE